MKLVRFGKLGREKPGIIDNEGQIRDLSTKLKDIDSKAINPNSLKLVQRVNLKKLNVVKGKPRLGVPVSNIGKIVCIGLNYVDHAKEVGAPLPKEPIIFLKPTSSLAGPNDQVMLPKGAIPKKGKIVSRLVDSKRSDWEVELGIVIGDKARSVPETKAMQYIAGYTIVNDVSERAYQLDTAAGQWTRGKGCDTFCPVGPWLVTKDEISRPQGLSIWLELNGKKMQDGNTKTMVFNIKELVSYVSHYMTLYPGDIIATGTPPGVGMGMKPPRYLKKGDEMKLGIDGLGEQMQKVVSWKK
ncbi:MAG: 2-hydroxyhepta-2,4-diene-1,7-dioate isomerase [Pelagibacterales bacterium]|nr:2-hydroxyhepta-2,4-diene-1,7-dioate isomerase [Pelagibacterales bacterium]OUU63461.1 MAG: 2-hydroxyhepta-2,4-diene-1,7-dioate isomerase [Alphaproteobacteria bacterium TMED62]|tara:strand:+ start:5207 stop:6100 length:894 start_codon:yes stop_codon:yes gene_type:complete